MEEPEDGIQLSGFFQLKPVDLFLGDSTQGALSGALVLAIWYVRILLSSPQECRNTKIKMEKINLIAT